MQRLPVEFPNEVNSIYTSDITPSSSQACSAELHEWEMGGARSLQHFRKYRLVEGLEFVSRDVLEEKKEKKTGRGVHERCIGIFLV